MPTPIRPPRPERPTPRLLGLRDGKGRLELWHWTRESGRRLMITSPCPDCESPIEVGASALIEGVWTLTVEMLKREGGPAMDLQLHGERFIADVVAHLPVMHAWAVDGCEIRAWVEDRGVVTPIVGKGSYGADDAGVVRLAPPGRQLTFGLR